MKRRRVIGLAPCAAALACAAVWPAHAVPAAPGEPVVWPEVSLLDGTPWSAVQARGKAVVAVFWSVTCPYCMRHNAHVERLRRATAGAALEVLTIARENDARAVRRRMDAQGWHFAVTLEAAPMAAALSQRRMSPLTVTVDRAGRLLQVIPGEMSEDDVMQLARLAL